MTPELFTQILTLLEGLPAWAKILGISIAVLGALSSIVASFVNEKIRKMTDAGQTPTAGLLTFSSVLNFTSGNIDKFVQLLKMARGLPVATTVTLPLPPVLTPGNLTIITAEEEQQIADGTHPTIKRAIPAPKPTV